jgi:hypothetical protein
MSDGVVVFRQRFCGDCRAIFFICRSCDRGQRYCSDHCRQKARRRQHREANRRHQQSPEGKLDHRDRQRAYRERQQGGVTDQSSRPILVSVTIPTPRPESIDAESAIESSACSLITCIICGRSGYWIQSFSERGYP